MAVSANEFRIGNWVMLGKEIRQVEGWMFIQECKNMTPILITPEILISCGFVAEESADVDERKIWSIQVANNTSLYYDPDLDNKHWYLSHFYNNNHFQNDFWGCPEYLHSLQNLFFALANEEIKYNPKA